MANLSRKSQRARILALLLNASGGWVPLSEILAIAAQYSARIFELRNLQFPIENRTERIDGVVHSWFRLAPARTKPVPKAAELVSPARHFPAAAESDLLFPLPEREHRDDG